ncbi:ArsC family transcriptional regulator [Butyricicoccus sp. 1XD8-22]|nr:ArsC family transcriptional regulator [Butyricicoccus sp. 1XD8-22]
MNIQIFGKNKCFDTKKAERWFKERRIKYQLVSLDKSPMSRGEFDSVRRALGGLEPLIDASARGYASLAYLAFEEDKIERLLDDPRLMRTPVVRNGRLATVGYCPETWAGWQ